MIYQIEITPTALKLLQNIKDRRIREKIQGRIDKLAENPEKQGKELGGELTDYRTVRAVGQRYRIIYRVFEDKVLVLVVAVGIRKEKDKADVYALAKKLIHLCLLEPPKDIADESEHSGEENEE